MKMISILKRGKVLMSKTLMSSYGCWAWRAALRRPEEQELDSNPPEKATTL